MLYSCTYVAIINKRVSLPDASPLFVRIFEHCIYFVRVQLFRRNCLLYITSRHCMKLN